MTRRRGRVRSVWSYPIASCDVEGFYAQARKAPGPSPALFSTAPTRQLVVVVDHRRPPLEWRVRHCGPTRCVPRYPHAVEGGKGYSGYWPKDPTASWLGGGGARRGSGARVTPGYWHGVPDATLLRDRSGGRGVADSSHTDTTDWGGAAQDCGEPPVLPDDVRLWDLRAIKQVSCLQAAPGPYFGPAQEGRGSILRGTRRVGRFLPCQGLLVLAQVRQGLWRQRHLERRSLLRPSRF